MLNNLERVRKEKGVSIVDIADLLNLRSQTVSEKIKGKYDFKFNEALVIQKNFFPEYEIVYLFTPESAEYGKEKV